MSMVSSRDPGRSGAAGDRDRLAGWCWRWEEAGEIGAEGVVELAGDVALEAADDLAFGEAFGGAAGQMRAKAASLRSRSMFWPAVISSWLVCTLPTPSRCVVRGAAVRVSCLSWRSSWPISRSRSRTRRARLRRDRK